MMPQQDLTFQLNYNQLQYFDVICGRGGFVYNHTGNQRFRKILKAHLSYYSDSLNKSEKSRIVSLVVEAVRSQGADFVRKNSKTGQYDKVSERIAREKVGQGFRDILHSQYRSSNEAKRKRKLEEKQDMDVQISIIIGRNKRVNAILNDTSNKVSSLISDREFTNLFFSANMNILKELKHRECARDMQ